MTKVMIITRWKAGKKQKIKKCLKIVSALNENQTPRSTFTLCVKRTGANRFPRLNFAARQNKPAAFHPFFSFFLQSRFTSMDFVPIRLASACLYNFFSVLLVLVLLLHVMCIPVLVFKVFSSVSRLHPFPLHSVCLNSICDTIHNFFAVFCSFFFSTSFFACMSICCLPRGFCPSMIET